MTDLSYIVEPLRPLAMPIDDLHPSVEGTLGMGECLIYDELQ